MIPREILENLVSETIIDQDLCAVMMPFSEQFDGVFECIRRACLSESVGMKCRRADDVTRNPAIIQDIVSLIHEASVIIADITDLNPNVLYELGISHAIKDRVILISQSLDDIPFDINHFRIVEYTNSIFGGLKLVEDVESILIELKENSATQMRYSNSKALDNVSTVTGLADCMSLINQSIEEAKTEFGEHIAIVRLLPAEISEAMIQTKKAYPKLKGRFERYFELIDDIIVGGNESETENWDYTIYGIHPNDALRRETLKFIRKSYFTGAGASTAELGVSRSVTGLGVIVLGESSGELKKFQAANSMLLFYNDKTGGLDTCSLIQDKQFSNALAKDLYDHHRRLCHVDGVYWTTHNTISGDVSYLSKIEDQLQIPMFE